MPDQILEGWQPVYEIRKGRPSIGIISSAGQPGLITGKFGRAAEIVHVEIFSCSRVEWGGRFVFVFVVFIFLAVRNSIGHLQRAMGSSLFNHHDLEPAHIAMTTSRSEQLGPSSHGNLQLIKIRYLEWDLTETLWCGDSAAGSARQREGPQAAPLH
jgi:hypothetical protein